MRVKLKNIVPNPFRRFDEYIPKRETVDLLKESIASTFFWQNIIGRKVNGKIEIAYGHHRLVALRELYPDGEKEFDIPTHDLTDEEMIKIMWSENETGGDPSIDSSVLGVMEIRVFLMDNPTVRKKYRNERPEYPSGVFANTAPGVRLIHSFVKGSRERIVISLRTLKAHEAGLVDKEVIESLPSHASVKDFIQTVEEEKPSKEIQKKVAEKIAKSREKGKESPKSIVGKQAVKEAFQEEMYPEVKVDHVKEFGTFLVELENKVHSVRQGLKEVEKWRGKLDPKTYGLKIALLMSSLDSLRNDIDKLFNGGTIDKEQKIKASQENHRQIGG